MIIKSTGRGSDLAAWPEEERDPLMARIDERRRENDKRHRSHPTTEQYGWPHLVIKRKASPHLHAVSSHACKCVIAVPFDLEIKR